MGRIKTLKTAFVAASGAALLAFAAPHAHAASTYDQTALGLRPVMMLNMDPAAAPVDLSGNGHTGTYMGGTPASATMPNGEKAPSFNGSSQYLTIPSSPKLSVPTKRVLTIVAWIKPAVLNFTRTENEDFVYILGKGNPSQGYEYANRIYSYNNSAGRPNRISFYHWNPNGGLGSGSYFQDAVNTTDWIMLTNIVDMNKGTIDIYKNGVLRDSTPLSQYSTVPQATNSPLNIGMRNGNSWFQGAVGKVSVYDRVLTTAELSNLYKAMTAAGTVTPPADTTAPSITGITASGLTASGASISWTTNEASDTQVEYGATTAYGQSSVLNTARVTAHSAALTGLSASTLYHYRVKSRDAAGNLATSGDQTFSTLAGAVPADCVSSAGTWQNRSYANQTGSFTAEYDATPSAANIDAVTGLSKGAASGYPSLAAAVRFNNAGRIDARNGGAYAAAANIPYTAGTKYRVRLVVNMTAKTYSAFVRQGTGTEQLIGSNYSFRTEQAGATSLDNIGLLATTGSALACAVTVNSSSTPPPVPADCVASAGTWQNKSYANQTGSFTAEYDATPAAANVDAVTGFSKGAASAYPALAAAVRFNNTGRIDARNGGAYAAAASIPYTAGTKYRVRLVVNMAAKTYSAFVRQGTGTEQLIGSNYSFRTEQLSATSLDNLGLLATGGSALACAVTVAAPPPPPPPATACVNSAGSWANQAFAGQAGTFTAVYDATPSAANVDGVTGLSKGAATGYGSLAAAVRFNNTGRIDARNGAAYSAATAIPYAAGMKYRVRLVVNTTAKTYSAFVRQGTGTEQLIGSGFSFRTDQAGTASLDNMGVLSTGGSVSACMATVSPTSS